jgi:hypothetical protein
MNCQEFLKKGIFRNWVFFFEFLRILRIFKEFSGVSMNFRNNNRISWILRKKGFSRNFKNFLQPANRVSTLRKYVIIPFLFLQIGIFGVGWFGVGNFDFKIIGDWAFWIWMIRRATRGQLIKNKDVIICWEKVRLFYGKNI